MRMHSDGHTPTARPANPRTRTVRCKHMGAIDDRWIEWESPSSRPKNAEACGCEYDPRTHSITTWRAYQNTHWHTHKHTHTHARAHDTCTHMHIHAHSHRQTHKHTHTHIYTGRQSRCTRQTPLRNDDAGRTSGNTGCTISPVRLMMSAMSAPTTNLTGVPSWRFRKAARRAW